VAGADRLGATADPELMREFGDIARQEYLAVGIRLALHPMVDLCTEPRWSPVYTCFGEDADLGSRDGYAYIRGLQGETLGSESVACNTKHFPGGDPRPVPGVGADDQGEDATGR
jgi:beta-glucosidase